MSLIFLAFLLSLATALALTPLARVLGRRLGALDIPDARKVHSTPTPRTGGLAIFAAAALTVVVVQMPEGALAARGDATTQLAYLLAGGLLCFAVGLVDDFRGLGARLKLLFQILAASIAFAGGARIGMGAFADLGALGVLASYGLTVLWFLLFINAVNLIDGLDGLAGGVSFFAALVMVLVSLLGNNLPIALLFAVLAGAILGFLRYNFNPASIFLGDGGSYFIGYAIAGLSILGNLKEQTGAAFLIPMIAMGLPLFDTVVSSLRRFVRGHNIFGADRRHVHHRLLDMGLSTRRAVLLLYLVTVALCSAALVLINFKDDLIGVLLGALFVAALLFGRELGYFRDLQPLLVRRWVDDVLHATGASRQRRRLLDTQLCIARAQSGAELWTHVVEALKKMEFDHARLYLDYAHRSAAGAAGATPKDQPAAALLPAFEWDNPDAHHPSLASANETSALLDVAGANPPSAAPGQWYYRVELPLACEQCGHVFGTLVLVKDHGLGAINQFTLPHVEHLRRAVMQALGRMEDNGTETPCGVRFASKVLPGHDDLPLRCVG